MIAMSRDNQDLYHFSLTATHRGQGIPRISSAAQSRLTKTHRFSPVSLGITGQGIASNIRAHSRSAGSRRRQLDAVVRMHPSE